MQFKGFVDIFIAGRHRGLSTIYIKHNFFHRGKLGRDVELQNTHIVHFKSPRHVMPVSTFTAQLGLRSEMVDWYRHATSVPFGRSLIDLSTRPGDRLRFCTNTGSLPSNRNFIYPTVRNSQKFWAMNTQNLSTLQVFQSFFQKCKSHFLHSCPKKFIRILCECIKNLLTGKLQSLKRHRVAKFPSEVRVLCLKRTTWKQRRKILASDEALQLIKVITPPLINHLS